MNEEQVQKQAANTLLERGVRFPIPAPFLLRVFGKKNVGLTIHQPKMGTLIYLSEGFVSMGIDPATLEDGDIGKAYGLVALHGKVMCRMMAVAVLNSRWKIRLFAKLLGNLLRWRLTAKLLADLFMMITALSGVQYFTSTIRFLPATNLMKVRNLSPKTEGSQEAELKASIAPGEQSGA